LRRRIWGLGFLAKVGNEGEAAVEGRLDAYQPLFQGTLPKGVGVLGKTPFAQVLYIYTLSLLLPKRV
jgi:hypothetical protein